MLVCTLHHHLQYIIPKQLCSNLKKKMGKYYILKGHSSHIFGLSIFFSKFNSISGPLEFYPMFLA